ncbi:MAG: AMP-binding protein [Thermoplasmatales archaeon]|nr:AMP-binding protein [Thermoplasmatales archaeon]MCW6170401.1 AMP-binding protein [Thermoplasmatales archaeon]
MLNISEVLDRSSEKWPNKDFINFNNRVFTFGSFREEVLRWVFYLRKSGIKAGDVISVFSKNRPEMPELWIAANRIGAIFSPYNFNLKIDELKTLVNNSKPSVMFTDSSLTADLGTKIVRFDEVNLSDTDEFLIETAPDDVSTLLYTSGTESSPKGVMNTHLNWYSSLISSIHDLDWQHEDVYLLSIPLYHVAGLYTFLGFMNVGATIVLEAIPNPTEIISLINRYNVTYLIFPPTVFIGLSQVVKMPFSSVKKCISFGAFISESQFNDVSKIFPTVQWRNYYGMTETTPMGTTLQPSFFEGRKESIGKPHINTSLKLVKEDGNEAKSGEVGEIWMRGPTVAKGYFKDEKRTKAYFEGGWYKSGDLAVMDKDGFLYFVDRKKDIIRTGGENVPSVEVERELLSYKSIAEAAVVGIKHPYWIEAVTAFVTAKKDQKVNAEEVIEYLKQRIANYKVPKKIIVLDSLPHSAGGKILKKELREDFRDLYFSNEMKK